jgi:hypothetical protein
MWLALKDKVLARIFSNNHVFLECLAGHTGSLIYRCSSFSCPRSFPGLWHPTTSRRSTCRLGRRCRHYDRYYHCGKYIFVS